MATVNYVKTVLSNKRFLVEWPNLSPGDDGQPFDNSESILLSLSRTRSPGDTIGLEVVATNINTIPTDGFPEAGPNFGSFNTGIAGVGAQYHWYFPRSPNTGSGSATASLLFEEI